MGSACGAWGLGVGALGGATKGRRWCCSAERRRTKKLSASHGGSSPEKNDVPSMEDLTGKLAGKRKTKGKQSNGDGFKKRKTLWCRERQDLPCGGGGRRRNATVWPEKLAEEFAGNLAVPNFGVRSAAIGVAAHEMGCTSEILASRATPAYIYT